MKEYQRFPWVFRQMGLIALLSFLTIGALLSQSNQIKVNVQVLPPYSNNIYDYIGSSGDLDIRLQEQMLITLQNNSLTESHEIKLIASVTGDNGLFAAVNKTYIPRRSIVLAPGELKVMSGRELKDINRNITENNITYGGFDPNQIRRTGTLPEGNYRICVEAYDYNTNVRLSMSEPVGCSPPIPIAFPDPPVIVYPFDQSEVLATKPQALNISWAPAPNLTSIVRYKVRIIELSDINANPYDLFERSTISFFEEDKISLTNLFYDIRKPAFKVGHTYALRVQAYDPFNQLQIKNDGKSEIHVFKYLNTLADGSTIADVDYINLQPGFLKLIDLDNLEVKEKGNNHIFNGFAKLEITTSDRSTPDVLRVEVNDLVVQKGNSTAPLILRGTVSARLSTLPNVLRDLKGLVSVAEMTWKANKGLNVSGTIRGPTGETYEATGDLTVRPDGLYGEISAKSSLKEPLFQFGTDPVQLDITSYGIAFPDVCKSFGGQLRLFGAEEPEKSIAVNTQSCGESITFDLSMLLNKGQPVDKGNGRLQLTMKSLAGSIKPIWDNQSLNYNLDIISKVGFANIDSISCGTDVLINLENETGVTIREAGNSCSSSQNNIPLGPAYLSYNNLSLDKLEYSATSGDWNFQITVDGEFTFPVFGGWTTDVYHDITINENGIGLPAMDYEKKDIFLTSAADWGDYLVYLEKFVQSPVTLPIFKSEKIGPGDWDFGIRARVEFKDDENIPECLRGGAINITGVNFDGKVMGGLIEPQNIGDCRWEFGEGYALNFNSIEGKVSVQFEGSEYYPLGGELKLDFDFLFGKPFACSGEKQVAVLDSELKIKNGLNGEVEKIIPPCELNIGPLAANVTESTLRFEASKNLGQNIFLDGKATLNYKDLKTKGTFTLNLKTGSFTDLSFKITEPFVLDLPTENKVISFNINEAEISEDGLLIDGRNELKLGNQTIGATFDNLLLDLSDNHIRSGSVIIDSPFAFEASIDQQNQLQFKAVSSDHELEASPGLLMKLAGTVKIDSTGLESSGTANAAINFEDIAYDSIYAEYSDDFKLGFYPFQIRKGQVDFYYQQQRIAYADGSGFHPDWTSFGEAFIPERIPLPREEIAYIQIKQNDQLLVNIRDDGMGNTVVSTKPGQPVQLFVPALQGDSGPTPQIAVDFNDLVLDGSNGSVIGGSVVATVPDNDPAFDLRQQGIPITPKQIAFGVDEQGDVNVTGLFIKGNLSLFNKDLGQPASVVLGIQSDGHLRGSINLQGINASVPMMALKDYVRLNFKNITGSIDIPLLAATNPYFNINFDSDFQIFNANDSLVVGAELSARYRPNDLSITDFNASVNQEAATINLDPFSIGIESLDNLSISYTKQDGFNFTTAIDCTFGYQLSNGTNFEFPLKNVELGSLNGFTIPAQDIHEGSWPGFDPPAVDFGVFRLQPLAFRLPAVNINWFSQSVNVGTFDPKVDLELSFPQLQYDAPEFSQSTFTFNDIGFDHGILTGSMLPFTFPGDGVFVPIGGDLGISVKEIAGLLEFASDSLQGFDINLKGKLRYPDFLKKDSLCSETQVTLSMDRNAHFKGLIEDFTPCGELKRGPLTLKFNNSELRFDVSASEQQASLSGSATALIERSGNNPVNATGNVALDLINGKLISGSILLTGPFEWQYTKQDSLFAFTVQTAKLDTTGLIFTGNGSLKLGNGSSNLTYNDLTFSLNNGKLTDGSVLIENEFALDIALNPVAWSIENPAIPTTNDPGLRLTMPANILLDKNGITVSDSSVASLSYDEQHYDLLKVNFDNFNLRVDPVQVKSGRADFFLDSLNGPDPVRIAYYDQTGFHLDDGTSLIKAVLPDTLYLPTEEIGYIVLRDQNGDLKVDIESVAQGKKINTQAPLPMVVNAFDPNNPMTMDVRIYDLIINDAFEVVQGYIESDMSSNPINLLPTEDIPLQLTKIAYLKDGNNPYSLFVDATLVLPKSLNDVEVKMEKLELGPGGFKSALVKAGVYSTTYDPNQPTLVDHSFSQGEFQFAVGGVELDFSQNGNAYRMSGQLGSSIFKDENGNNSIIHYAAQYNTGTGWDFDLDAHHLPQMEIPIDKAKMILDNLEANFDDTKFELVIDSRLTFDDVMGGDFEITINDLKIGTDGISVNSINTDVVQYLSLFNQTDNLQLTDLGISFDNSILFISLDGTLTFMDRDLDFTALKIGTDGSVALDGLNTNLLTQDFEILGQYLVLKEIGLTTLEGKIALTAGGEVNMPEPFEQADNALTITVNYLGQAEVEMPSLTATNIPDVDLGGFAVLDMTEVGIDFDPMDIESTAFFASADLNIPDDKTGDVNTIEFGTPNGDINAAGIYYRYSDSDINWQITNSPSFTFDQTFFKLSIENISAGSSGGFKVTMDADASLQFEQVDGGGRMEGITIDKTGVDWGTFAGANFTFIDFVNIEVGSFEYFNDGGNITLEKGSGNGPESSEVSEESIYVDEYLNFSNPTGNALSISIGDPDGFSVSGGIESIIYYKKGDELYFNMKGATIELHDMARLYASVEYQKNDTGFLLRVAGSALITPPGSEIGVVAVGKLANINDQFSMGIFVATKGVPIPIIPAIVEINKFGGGFFYHAESADLNLVTEATDYDPYKEEVPWESGDRTFDFAIIFYGGIGVIGTSNNYTFEGEMMMVIASDFLLIDSRFEMNTAPLEGGAYFSMDFQSDRFVLEAGGGMQLKDLGVVKGGLGVNFTAIKYKNQDNLQWAFTGGTTVAGGTPIKIVGILEANATVVVSNDGFLLDCSVEAGFDIWIVSVNGGLEATVWYLAQQKQFGVYAEVHIEASVLGGLAKLGGNAKGALIIEKGDFLIYASLTGYVEVLFVFEGNMTAWVSIQNSGFDAGLGKSGYEDMIEEARRNAQNLNEKAESLISSIEDAKNAIIPLSNETLAKSGQALFMASDQVRQSWGNDFIQNEQRLKSPVPQAFQDMRNEVVDGNRPEDNKRNIMLYQMKNAIQVVNDNSADVLSELQKLKASAIEWEAQSENMVANLQNPVQKQMEWQGDIAPSFGVDTIQSATNASESEGLKQTIDQLSDEAFEAAIDTTLMNIHKIEKSLDGRRYSLASSAPTFGGPSLPDMPEGNETENNVLKMAHRYSIATERVRRYYGTQISYFWALYHWAKHKVDNYDQMTTFYQDGPLNQANKAVTEALGIEYLGSINAYYYQVTMGGIEIVDGAFRADWDPVTWSDLSSSQKSTFKNGLTKNINTVADAIGKRRYFIQTMNPDIDEQTAISAGDQLENNVKDYWNQNQFFEFINSLNASSIEVKQMHLLGLEAIRDMAYDKADSLVDAADRVLDDLDENYEHFTSIQNDVYQIKHSMLVSLYGMYDLYSGWKENDEDASYYINQKINELENLLNPPRINNIGLISNRGENGYDRELMIGWRSFHPYGLSIGNIESSYNILRGNSNSIYARGFKSTGQDEAIYYHTYAEDEQAQSQDLTIRIRVRGPGGNTVTRFINTNVVLAPDAGEVSTSDFNLLEEDTSPPTAPIVSLNYKKNQPAGFTEEKYWSNDLKSMSIGIVAFDNESDIVKVEYAIGSTKGGTDIVDWKEGQTTNNLDGNNSLGNVAKTVVARNLDLEVGKDYYVSARVTNGEGMTSAITEQSTPLRLDLGRPANLTEELTLVMNPIMMPVFLPGFSYTPNFVTTTPTLESPPVPVNGEYPRVDVKWNPGMDSLSGIYRYEYIISDKADPNQALTTNEVAHKSRYIQQINISGDPLDFNDTTYVHVWAKDYAGNRSAKALTFARLPKDNTAPKAPYATLMTKPDGLRLFIKKPSYDPESRVKGMQYAVGTTPYGTDIKPWPQDGEYDELEMNWGDKLVLVLWRNYAVGEYSNNWPGTFDAPYYEIPPTSIPEGQKLYISYRTVNGQGMVSGASGTGPVVLDTSAPPRPGMSLVFNSGKLEIKASQIKDDQSGIVKVEYVVQEKYGSYNPYPQWNDLLTISGVRTLPFNYTRKVNWGSMPQQTTVGIRLTNGNGMQSTYWFDGSQYGIISIEGINDNYPPITDYNINWN